MAERYSKLFSLPENLYAQGSPVVIAAGALLKDNVAGNVLAQLKIQSISDKPIKAVKVAITPLDSVGRLLGGEVEYQYLDLDVKRDDFFGVKTPVALPDSTTRSYTVRVVEVAFGDNSLWNEAGAPCETLPKQRTLASALGDAGIAEQYKKDVGNNWSDREPAEHKDLWLCACGAINKRSEPCHKCLKTFAELTNFDVEKLKENREAWRKNDIYSEAETLMKQGSYEQAINEFARIRGWCDSDAMITACENKIKEREEKAKADALAAKLRVKKQKRRAITITIIVLIIIALALATYYVGIPYIKYRQALVMIEHGEYTEAYTQLEELNGFYDSEEQIKAGKYKQALEMISDGGYDRAYSILTQLGDYNDAQNVINQSKYDRGIAYIEAGEYGKGYRLLDEVIEYKDAEQQIYDSKYARGVAYIEAGKYNEGYALLSEIKAHDVVYESKYNRAIKLLDEKKYNDAYKLLKEIGNYNGAPTVINESKYNRGIEYFENGDYNSGYNMLMSIKSYKDAESQAKELLYQQGLAFYNDKDYETASSVFKTLGSYEDSKTQLSNCETAINDAKYDNAVTLMNKGDYEEAISIFKSLGSHKDSKTQVKNCYIGVLGEKNYKKIKNASIGDTITFGKYEQDNILTNGMEKIEWIILDVEDDRALLISKYALDRQQYSPYFSWDMSWETCSLRKWLNSTFIYNAFSPVERQMISLSNVVAHYTPGWSDNGNNVNDKIFLLSYSEAKKSYFSSSSARMCEATAYAKAHGAHVDDEDNCWWWLRSLCGYSEVSYVSNNGATMLVGAKVNSILIAVRPALWIDLSE